MATTEVQLSSKIPSGVWTLYFHSPGEKRWSIDTFHKLGVVETWQDYWSLVRALEDVKWTRGMFFWMRGTVPPLWENFQNIKGGSYSICISETDSIDVFHRYTIACMFNIATVPEDTIQGITISPKKGFHVIKLWNKEASKFNKSTGLTVIDKRVADVRYTPHVEKKM